MKILIINPVHPATPHISAVRAWCFARELAAMGHRVVLLCAARDAASLDSGNAICGHDWSQPYVLAPSEADIGAVLRLPMPLCKAVTAWRLVRNGGAMGKWVRHAEAVMERLTDSFRPDVIWTTYGRMEAVITARRIARRFHCPWVLDVKDNWELYVPHGLRRLMSSRTRGWAALTANSGFTREKARIWQRAMASVIYSGVSDAFFSPAGIARADRDAFRINLIGGLYYADRLTEFLEGIRRWLHYLPLSERGRIELSYLGGDVNTFRSCATPYETYFRLCSLGYVTVDRMACECRHAAVNSYITHEGTFHHKLLELLSCGRPVLAFPMESDEARRLAREVRGELLEPRDVSEVAAQLDHLYQRRRHELDSIPMVNCSDYSWPAQAQLLEKVLIRVAKNGVNR